MTSVRFVDHPPREIKYNISNDEPRLQAGDMDAIAEIFRTPLVGSYTWNYEEADRRIRKLYRLGKERNWNAETEIDWSPAIARSESPILDGVENPFEGWESYDALTEAEEIEFAWHQQSWMLSQFLHGEQGALLVASQLVSCAPTFDAKLYAASQTFDEARHVEVFTKYIMDRVGFMYPINKNLKILLDKILTDERWDLKFIGMQLIIESLALAAFNTQKLLSRDPVMQDVLDLVTRDESRHVAFGVTYMEQFVRSLPQEEVEARAQFAYEACVVMRERILSTDVIEHYGWDVEEGRRRALSGAIMQQFRNLLFTRIIPNLKKVGLITPSVRPLYDELGVLQYENLIDDGQIDWAQMEAPLPAYKAGAPAPRTNAVILGGDRASAAPVASDAVGE